MKILVTGGAGFIGSTLIRHLITETDYKVINLDKLTYAGNLDSLESVASSPRYQLAQIDICDRASVNKAFEEYQPSAVIHLAAESHVDRSIDEPEAFIETNVTGTCSLLEASRAYWMSLKGKKKDIFRFLHVSTEEVYGDLGETNGLFTENSPYSPSSPYSASKAASDHLVRAWKRTYGLPVIIPHIILNAISAKPLPVYGDGSQIRDWIHVDDHVRALVAVFQDGIIGETYNIGGHNERRNIDLVEDICEILEEIAPERKQGIPHYRDLISFVVDRPGHDHRYAIDTQKIQKTLGWTPRENYSTGLKKTVIWYLSNSKWWERVLSGEYRLNRIGEYTSNSPSTSR